MFDLLTANIERVINSRQASTFYISAPRGTGRTYLLQQIAEHLCKQPRVTPLGPFPVSCECVHELPYTIWHTLQNHAFIEPEVNLPSTSSLSDTWKAFAEQGDAGSHTFVVLVDLQDFADPKLAFVAPFLSDARHLEGIWSHAKVRVSTVIAGSWTKRALDEHYRDQSISFPYTQNYNYALWLGLDESQTHSILASRRSRAFANLYGPILSEITADHPATLLAILDQISDNAPSIGDLLDIVRRLANTSPVADALVEMLNSLSKESKEILAKLLVHRRLSDAYMPGYIEPLTTLGVVVREPINERSFLRFRSWFIELVLQAHAEELGIATDDSRRIRQEEILPALSTLNTRAYALIHELENLARNFVAISLSIHEDSDTPLLSNYSLIDRDRQWLDARNSAMAWKQKSSTQGLNTNMNALTAYLTTRDLSIVIRQIGQKHRIQGCNTIADAVYNLADLRDAVMHNQLIDDKAFQKLLTIRFNLYEALSQTD